MPKKHSKSQPKSNLQLPTSQSQDKFQHLLDSQIYSSPTGSSSNPQHAMGFSGYSQMAPVVNPYSLPPDDPRTQTYMNMFHQHQQQQQHGFFNPSYPSFQTPIQTPIQTPPEEVEETQPEPEQSDPKGKKVACKKVPWTPEESRILAERWIHVSENSAIGNSQTKDSFWGAVRRAYNSLVGEPRRADQITGKWSKMAKDVKLFIGIYSKLEEHWQSGAGDTDIMLNARRMFKQQTGRLFSYEEAWRVLKDCPKFLAVEGVMSNKRKTPIEQTFFQEDPINLEDDNPNPTDHSNPSQFETLFRQDPIRRPPGRSKSQRSSGSSDAASRLSAEEARQKVVDSAESTQRTMQKLYEESEKRTELASTRTMFKGLKLLSKPVSRDLPPDEYRMIMKAREKIKRRYATQFEDSEDEE